MEESNRTNQLPLWIGVLGIVLLLVGTLIYAAWESETRYQSDLVNQITGSAAAEYQR